MALIVAAALVAQAQEPNVYQVEAGSRIPLNMLKTVSTKTAEVGDPVYLETVFPIVVRNRILIPRGSYVTGTVTATSRAGKVKGRAELRLRLESLILPNGATRRFPGSVASLDSQNGEQLDRAESAIKGKGNKSGDLKNVMTGAGYGAMAGAAIGAATIDTTPTIATGGRPGQVQVIREVGSAIRRPTLGAGIGMAGGAAAVFMATLFMRGPDAVLSKGTELEMVLDRPIVFDESELAAMSQPAQSNSAPSPTPSVQPQPQPSEPGLKKR